jgi:hypothetical protein
MTWLTSAPRPGLAAFKNSISLDQLIAHRLSGTTRLLYLCLSNDGGSLAWTANGINIPAESSPARLFKTLPAAVIGTAHTSLATRRTIRLAAHIN